MRPAWTRARRKGGNLRASNYKLVSNIPDNTRCSGSVCRELDVPGLVVDLKKMQTRQQGLLLAGVIGHGEQGWGTFGDLKRL